jgi:hypothetical protein
MTVSTDTATGTLNIEDTKGNIVSIRGDGGSLNVTGDVELTGKIAIDPKPGEVRSGVDLKTLRIGTQVLEIAIQGYTARNTFKEMGEVWLSLMDKDQKAQIVEQHASKVKYQLVQLYSQKMIKYVRSVIGFDLIPSAQADLLTKNWRIDSLLLNIASNKINSHEHLFRLLLINVFGLSEQLVDLFLAPTSDKLRQYVNDTYGINLGEPVNGITPITISDAENALNAYIAEPSAGYKIF